PVARSDRRAPPNRRRSALVGVPWRNSVKDRFLDHSPVYQVLDDDSLEERGSDTGVPNTVRVYDDDRPTGADTETGRLSALHSVRPEEQSVTLKKGWQELIQLSPAVVGRAKSPDTDQQVPGIGVHSRKHVGGHEQCMNSGL